MKTTTKSRKNPKQNPHDAANEALDAMMSERDKAYWERVRRIELGLAVG